MTRFTGPDGPYPVQFEWPEGICGHVTGKFIVKTHFGREVPEPVDLLCTRGAGHEPAEDHFTELNWYD
jgi:hypothetical protein